MSDGSARKRESSKKLLAIVLTAACAPYLADWAPAPTAVSAAGEQHATSPTILPPHYRDWKLISVAHEAGKLNDLRAILGNAKAIDAFRRGTLPFPDGAIIARVAWAYTPSSANNKAFGQEQSFVAGEPTNVQLMVKDSGRYASTGGWGFAQFEHGRPAAVAINACFSCHVPAKEHNYVFTHYAP